MSFKFDESTGKKLGGTLNNWYEKRVEYTEDPERNFSVVFGHLDNDNRWRDGTKVRTSTVVKLDTENGVLETRNTVYQLGEPMTNETYVHTGLMYGVDESPEPHIIDTSDNGE